MGYNTRRKSLSLPSLGIALPGGPRAARSPPTTADSLHVAKKIKRSHSGSISSTPTTPPRLSSLRFDERPKSSAGRVADTPPPSPGGESGQTKVDTQGIDDIIVVGVIEQLQKTGNRPHLLKELATVLSPTIPIVERYVPMDNAPSSCTSPCVTHADAIQFRQSCRHYFVTSRDLPQAQLVGAIALSSRQEASRHTSQACLLLSHHHAAPTHSRGFGQPHSRRAHYHAFAVFRGFRR